MAKSIQTQELRVALQRLPTSWTQPAVSVCSLQWSGAGPWCQANAERPPLPAPMERKHCRAELAGKKAKIFAPMTHNSAWVMHTCMHKHYRLHLVKLELYSHLLLQSKCSSKCTVLHTGAVQQHKAAGESTILYRSTGHDVTSCPRINQQHIDREPKTPPI